MRKMVILAKTCPNSDAEFSNHHSRERGDLWISREKGLEWSRTYFLESLEWYRIYILDHLLLPLLMIQLTIFFKAKPSGFSNFM